MNWLVLLGFFALQVLIGLWASRRVSSEVDYFVAGRRLGLPLVTMSLVATWFGAETCLGASGAIYEKGLSGGRADPFGYALCLLLMGVLLAARLSRGRFLTLGDLYRERFGRRAERLAVLVLVPSSLTWGAAQVRAFGQVLAITGSIEVDTAILVSAGLVVAYTFLGGLMGDVLTDFVQGTLLALGLVALLVVCLTALPEAPGALETALSAERLSLLPAGESPWVQIDRWSVPILGSLIAQELIARVLAARTPEVARRGALMSAGTYLLLGCIPVTLGLLGPALAPGLAEPEQLLPALATAHFPRAIALLFSCALLAAILSTVDSILLSASALLSHNFLVPVCRVQDERAKLWLGRSVVVAAGGICLAIALSADGIYALVETASSLGTAGILVTTLAALFLERPREEAALVALLVGAIGTPLAEHWLRLPAPFLVTVVAALTAYVGVTTLCAFWPSIAAPVLPSAALDRERKSP
jgi:SSS family transporter